MPTPDTVVVEHDIACAAYYYAGDWSSLASRKVIELTMDRTFQMELQVRRPEV